jgi:hypothetical protein
VFFTSRKYHQIPYNRNPVNAIFHHLFLEK